MGVGSGLYMYDVVVIHSRSLSHLLMSSCSSSDRNIGRQDSSILGIFTSYSLCSSSCL